MNYEQASKKARKQLIENAVQSIQYVAFGKVMKRDLAQEFNLPEEYFEKVLAEIANNLCSRIQRL